MRKKIYKLVFSIIFGIMMTQQMQIEAANDSENIEQIDILQETETSVVIDMHMKQAERLPDEGVSYPNPLSAYRTTKSPAQITKQGDFYFITDTFHDQVIYSRRLEAPISEWSVMTSKVAGPHSVASDGTYYLVADTENHRVLVYEWKRGGFRQTQVLAELGKRPHYIAYDETTDSFYAWSSLTGEMYILTKDSTGIICIKEIRRIKELEGHYIRSFTISGDFIMFPSGTNRQILLTDKNSLQIIGRYLVPDEVSGMAYILPIGNYFYMTVSSDETFDQSKATIIRAKDLNRLKQGEYEDISSLFPDIQIPYYIDSMQGMYYMTNHGSSKNVLRFNVENDEIRNIGVMQY